LLCAIAGIGKAAAPSAAAPARSSFRRLNAAAARVA